MKASYIIKAIECQVCRQNLSKRCSTLLSCNVSPSSSSSTSRSCLAKQDSIGCRSLSSIQRSKKNSYDDSKESSENPINYISANPHPDPIEHQNEINTKERIPISQVIPLTFKLYKSTWNGFFGNYGNKDKSDDGNNTKNYEVVIDEEGLIDKQKDMRKNIKRNVQVLRKEGGRAIEAAKDITGIRNKDDLIEWSMIQLKLANECVREFMSGYRKGRDEEIDKMMNLYFQDIEGDDVKKDEQVQDQEQKIKRGRRKRGRKSKW